LDRRGDREIGGSWGTDDRAQPGEVRDRRPLAGGHAAEEAGQPGRLGLRVVVMVGEEAEVGLRRRVGGGTTLTFTCRVEAADPCSLNCIFDSVVFNAQERRQGGKRALE
jgi:hypothetical protein